MGHKVLFSVLVAFLAVSVLAENNQRKNVVLENFINGSHDTLIEFVEQLLLGVNKLFSEAVHEVAYGIITLFDALGEFRDFGIQFSETVIDREVEILNAVIEKYKNETSEESKAIWQCIEDIEGEAVLVRDQAINSSFICIDAEIQAVGDGIMQILVDIRTLNEDLRTEEKTLETCKNETDPVDCLNGIIDTLGQIVITLTTQIITDADKAQTEYDNLGIAIEKCANDAAAVVEKENERVMNDFSECVYERQNSSTSSP